MGLNKLHKVIAAGMILGICVTYKNTVLASCWGSNPDGKRTCQEFVSKSGLHLQLCEDQAGDCERAGYTPTAQSEDRGKAVDADGAEISAPSHQRHRKASEASTGGPTPQQEDDNSFNGLLIIAGVLVIAFIFGGRFVRAFIAGTVLGVAGASETAFYGTMAAIQLDHMVKDADGQSRKQEKLFAERETLLARTNQLVENGADRATGLSGAPAHKRLRRDWDDWERRARKAGWG